MTQPTPETGGLHLVPLAEHHLELEAELDSDPEVIRYLTGRALSRPELEQAHRRRLNVAREAPALRFWVGFSGGDDHSCVKRRPWAFTMPT